MSIYQQVMGKAFSKLHPKLQNRYDLFCGNVFKASGIMHEIKGGPKWLYPLFIAGVKWNLLFPEHGKDIPFTIKNIAFIDENGVNKIHWERVFHFGKKKRYFNALMSLNQNRLVIEDYLGEPTLFYSDLDFHVSEDKVLTITSLGQRLVLGRLEIPVPRIFQGLATVKEWYDDERNLFTIHVVVRNPLIGHIFSYKGEFKSDE